MLRAFALVPIAAALGHGDGALAQESGVQLVGFELWRNPTGVGLNFQARFELPRAVEDALIRGVPLHFVAEAAVYRRRWYWRDERIGRVSRHWRLAWQPLTRSFRVSFGGLHQTYDTLVEALGALRGAVDWRLVDAVRLEDDESYYVEFRYWLDTDELPRPMQIGLAGQADWALSIERREDLP